MRVDYKGEGDSIFMNYVWKVDPGSNVTLKDYDSGYTDTHNDRVSADLEIQALSDELNELQELLAAAQKNSLLVVLQGMDTSGKDGTIRHVLSHVNPQGCFVHAFKAPTQEELGHDFLWRVHKVTPAKGEMGIFNRSHYEDVLVARVKKLVQEKVWSLRYEEINSFEHLLTQSGIILLKFFLHISYDEQERRLLAREEDKDKSWKLSAEDWEDRKYWKEYEKAYEDALSMCSTNNAAWYIVPGNHKWYRNLAVAHTIVHKMRQYKDEWKTELEARGQRELEKLKQIRSKS
jgi:PPK2 family polyphosphate:nucleotide phosphotransferase